MTPPSNISYLVVDIETVADGRLIQKVRYPEEPDLSPTQALERFRQDLEAEGRSTFIPFTYQLPVSVAIGKVASDFSLLEVVTLDRPRFRPQVITQQFWDGWRRYNGPTLVTFNGRTFDLPVLEMCAFRFGVQPGGWFDTSGPGYAWPRNRYQQKAHLDLLDVLGNFGAVPMAGGLNLLATLLSKPGKMETKGSMVQQLWDDGEKTRIDNYCMCDVLDTYFVFLRTRVLGGDLTLEYEHKLVEKARAWIEKAAAENPALTEYLAHFKFWNKPGPDDDPFLG